MYNGFPRLTSMTGFLRHCKFKVTATLTLKRLGDEYNPRAMCSYVHCFQYNLSGSSEVLASSRLQPSSPSHPSIVRFIASHYSIYHATVKAAKKDDSSNIRVGDAKVLRVCGGRLFLAFLTQRQRNRAWMAPQLLSFDHPTAHLTRSHLLHPVLLSPRRQGYDPSTVALKTCTSCIFAVSDAPEALNSCTP
jgi:hypothetical protein